MFDERCDDEDTESLRNFSIQAIQDGVRILDTESNWNQLLYKEALNIERKDPTLNKGLKASRKLRLFRWRKIHLTSVDIGFEAMTTPI